MDKKYIISKYVIYPAGRGKGKWRRVMINGEKTCYEMNNKGELRLRDSKRIITPNGRQDSDYYFFIRNIIN